MSSYRVYLTDNKNKDTMYNYESKTEVIECVNDANNKGYYSFKIIMNMEGTDIFIKRGLFSNKAEFIEIPELDNECRIQGGIIINCTKPQRTREETNNQDRGER